MNRQTKQAVSGKIKLKYGIIEMKRLLVLETVSEIKISTLRFIYFNEKLHNLYSDLISNETSKTTATSFPVSVRRMPIHLFVNHLSFTKG